MKCALVLVKALDTQFITDDRRLFKAVSKVFPWVLWRGDYQPV